MIGEDLFPAPDAAQIRERMEALRKTLGETARSAMLRIMQGSPHGQPDCWVWRALEEAQQAVWMLQWCTVGSVSRDGGVEHVTGIPASPEIVALVLPILRAIAEGVEPVAK